MIAVTGVTVVRHANNPTNFEGASHLESPDPSVDSGGLPSSN